MRNIKIELYDCNYDFGGYVNIKCDSFESKGKDIVIINGATISFGNEIKEITEED